MGNTTIGFALTGSYCTFQKVIPEVQKLCDAGYNVLPIMSENAQNTDTRFGNAKDFIDTLEKITNNNLLRTIKDAEPIGPKKLINALIIAPCTGNTLGKLTGGITDTNVTMAAKATLRNHKPVIIALSTNDGLSASAKNVGSLLNTRNIYFVPFTQDDFKNKERSLVADFSLIQATLEEALLGKQIQPTLLTPK